MPIRMDNMRSLFISNHSKTSSNSIGETSIDEGKQKAGGLIGKASPSPLLQFLKSRSGVAATDTAAVGSSSSSSPSKLSVASSIISQATATVVTEQDDDCWSQCSSITEAKSVSFAPIASYRPTLGRAEYTKAEKQAAWFQRDEFDEITRQCVKQVQRMEMGGSFKDKKYCSRGLEGHTEIAAMAKQRNREAAYAAVLDEQEYQWQSNVRDDERISELYNDVSSSCLLWANSIGLRDQKVADDYLLDV